MDELGRHYVNEIIQEQKDKGHMISLNCGTKKNAYLLEVWNRIVVTRV
jgi:hypothetical protein